MKQMNEDDQNPKIESALRSMSRDQIFVPPATDEKVLSAIRGHFEVGTRCRASASPPKPKSWQKWMPLAASVAIAALILFFSRPVPDRADINHDGTVDVIDALLLAEQVRAGRGRDINGDKTVTEADAAEIAARAVALERTRS